MIKTVYQMRVARVEMMLQAHEMESILEFGTEII